MKKKHQPKLGSLGILIGVLILAVIAIYIVPKTNPSYIPLSNVENSDLKTHTSQALEISFRYPKDWILSELGGRSINIVNPGEEKIKILITKTTMLQNQSFKDYIDLVDRRANNVNKVLSEESQFLGYKEAIKRVIEPIVGSDLRKYVIIFGENNSFVYTISATPADSELIPIFNQIVNSIEFK